MLKLVVPGYEVYHENTNEFTTFPDREIELEHSLASVQKWESKWKKSFISSRNKTKEELLDYVRCMIVTKDVPDNICYFLTQDNWNSIEKYMRDPMTATVISKDKKKQHHSEPITAELIYYWMVSFGIPFECNTWNLNELFTLIEVCSIKNTPPKKRSAGDILRSRAPIMAARRMRNGG